MGVWRNARKVPVWAAGLCLGALLSGPAVAKTHHHESTQHSMAGSGFGPTSAGVSSILIDAATGNVIAAQGADVPRYPASLTKLMTLDLAFEALRDGRMTLETEIPVSKHAAAVEPVKLGLRPGQEISVGDAILAMTTMSANDAATALGEYLGGGSELRCAQMMTLRAHALGMAQTHFDNASGLPNPNQVTTARDLAILARDIVRHFPEDQSFFEVTSFEFEGRAIYSNNHMLKTYPGTTGMKTGYTNAARHNLITSAVRNGQTLIGVVLHEPSWGSTYTHMTAMLNSGFSGGGAPEQDQGTLLARNTAPVRPAPEQVASRAPAKPAPLAVATRTKPEGGANAGAWAAQVGVYSQMITAKQQALAVQHLRGVGVPRIAKIERHGKTLWRAQLAGLTHTAAQRTCNLLQARGSDCLVVAPNADHLALRELTDDSGT